MLEVEQLELEQELKMKEQREKDRLIPEIERFQKMIADMHKTIANNEIAIEKEQEKTVELG